MRSALRLAGVVTLALALLASTAGLCLCCPARTAQSQEHACCAQGGTNVRAADSCCAAMGNPLAIAVIDGGATASPPATPIVLSARSGHDAPRPTSASISLTVGTTHSPPSAVLRI